MNATTKSILILVGTLLVGVLLGALGAGAVINNRVEQLEQLRASGRVFSRIEDIVQPTAEQQAQIREILDRNRMKQRDFRQYVFQEHRALMDSTRIELESVLTEEQMTRLAAWMSRDFNNMRFRREGPPPNRRRGPRDGRRPFRNAPPPADSLMPSDSIPATQP